MTKAVSSDSSFVILGAKKSELMVMCVYAQTVMCKYVYLRGMRGVCVCEIVVAEGGCL